MDAARAAVENEQIGWAFDPTADDVLSSTVPRVTSGATLTKLAGHPNVWVRSSVARNAHTPKAVIAALTEDTETHVRSSAVSNPRCPQANLAAVVNEYPLDSDEVMAAVSNPNCPLEAIHDAVERSASHVDAPWFGRFGNAVLGNPECPEPIIRGYIATRPADVVEHERCPGDVLDAAARDFQNHPLVALNALGNPSCPEDTIEDVCRSEWATDQMKMRAAANRGLSERLLTHFASGMYGDAAAAAAADSPAVLAHPRVAVVAAEQCPNSKAARQVASDKSAPPDVLERLASTTNDEQVQKSIVKNPATPAAVLSGVWNHSVDPQLKRLVLRNPSCPETVLEQAATTERKIGKPAAQRAEQELSRRRSR